MKTEIEAKFVKLDIDDVRARLKRAGATLEQPMRTMRRQAFDPVENAENAMSACAMRAIKSR